MSGMKVNPDRASIALYRAMDMIFWLPQAEAALAQIGAVG
jgi:hypothetical protein